MIRQRLLAGSLLLGLLSAAPLAAQQRTLDWQYKWFWGAHAGMTSYTLPTSGTTFTPQAGVEWLITARSVALFVAYSQTFQSEADTFAIQGLAGNNNTVTFDGMRRIQVGVVAMMGSKKLQPYAGAGFSIHTLTNAQLSPANPSAQDAVDDAASGGFGMILGGVNYRVRPKLAVYAQFLYTPQGRDFLLAGGSTSLSGGVRYAFMNAKADDSRTRR